MDLFPVRNENINWDTDMVHSARPCRAVWAVTFHIRAALLTTSPDTPMHHGRAAGKVQLGQSVMCLETWQQLRAFPLRTTRLNVTTAPYGGGRVFFYKTWFIFPCFLTCRGERDTYSVKGKLPWQQFLTNPSWGGTKCFFFYRQFYFFCTCTFYFIAWLAETG